MDLNLGGLLVGGLESTVPRVRSFLSLECDGKCWVCMYVCMYVCM